MNNVYRKQVELLIRIMPSVYKIPEFAVHGGTAINLFHKNMPRYSVDIDLTYIPLQDRTISLDAINLRLSELKNELQKVIPGISVIHRPDVWKLLCRHGEALVKIEVNGTKRGLIGDFVDLPLCEKATIEFRRTCRARTVSYTQLYGGKISAALSRQHPRDIFDYKYMDDKNFESVKDGLILCLLGSDKPIVESLEPYLIRQEEALENQFQGMTDIPFSYDDYLSAREELISWVNTGFSPQDKAFLYSFEKGEPDWSLCSAGNLSGYPSVSWKLQNILKLKATNPRKFSQGLMSLSDSLSKNG